MDQPAQFAELRGFLAAFEWVNSKTDHGYTFTLDAKPDSDSREQLARDHFRIWEPTDLRLSSLTDPRRVIRESTLKWLRRYISDVPPYCMKPNATFSLACDAFDDEFATSFMERLECAGSITQGYSIEFRTESFYECSWDDYLVIAGDWAVFLHFGVSD